MVKYLIIGGNRLEGTICISGNKNAILPCLAATLLTKQEVILENIPKIEDVQVFIEILKVIGSQVIEEENRLRITNPEVKSTAIPEELARKIRASVLLVGPLLARVGRAEFNHPGGDLIGMRSIEAHLRGFETLGAKIRKHDLKYTATFKGQGSFSQTIFLDEPSVTATENLIMASVLGKGTVVLKNCAQEPHIIDLCVMLSKMGAKISGIGTNTLSIKQVSTLHGTTFPISFDFMELGTYAVAAAITKGAITMQNSTLKDMEPVVHSLSKMGVRLEESSRGVRASAKKILPYPHLKPNHWPGFPTDLMSVMVVLATQARGVSLLHDWMYESRMFFVDKLISMGGQITIADPHRVLVYGVNKLQGRDLETPDIRAGMALVLAALVAQGGSTINRAELIERGYANVVENLTSLGANIIRLEE